MKVFTKKGRDTEFHHIVVGCRGYVDKKTIKTFRDCFGFSKSKLNQMISKNESKNLLESSEIASFFIWLKKEDDIWSEK